MPWDVKPLLPLSYKRPLGLPPCEPHGSQRSLDVSQAPSFFRLSPPISHRSRAYSVQRYAVCCASLLSFLFHSFRASTVAREEKVTFPLVTLRKPACARFSFTAPGGAERNLRAAEALWKRARNACPSTETRTKRSFK